MYLQGKLSFNYLLFVETLLEWSDTQVCLKVSWQSSTVMSSNMSAVR